jgi:hypothetical protein
MMRIVTGMLLALLTGAATAQTTVYRCGNAYTTVPCPEGRVVDTSDALASLERKDQATRVAASEKRLAADMERDRLHAEASIKPAAAASLGPGKPVARDVKAKPKRGGGKKAGKRSKDDRDDREDFIAAVPRPAK